MFIMKWEAASGKNTFFPSSPSSDPTIRWTASQPSLLGARAGRWSEIEQKEQMRWFQMGVRQGSKGGSGKV